MDSTRVEIGADSVSQMGATRVEIDADSVSQMISTRVEIRADSVSQMDSPLVEIGADSVSQMGSTRVEIGADSVSQMDSTRVVLANPAPGQPDVSKPQPGTAEVFLPLGPVLTNTTQSTLTGSKFTPARPTKTVSSQAKAKPSWARGSEAGMYRRRNSTRYYKSDTGTIEERGWME